MLQDVPGGVAPLLERAPLRAPAVLDPAAVPSGAPLQTGASRLDHHTALALTALQPGAAVTGASAIRPPAAVHVGGARRSLVESERLVVHAWR